MAKAVAQLSGQRRVLFARVGWMRFYNGSVPGDERPVGGGSYNESNIGHEVYNFRETDERLYGYFQPPMSTDIVALERIDREASPSTKQLNDVLVIFVARRPDGGQVIVGWYGNCGGCPRTRSSVTRKAARLWIFLLGGTTQLHSVTRRKPAF